MKLLSGDVLHVVYVGINMIKVIVLISYLIAMSLCDLKDREVPVVVLVLFSINGVLNMIPKALGQGIYPDILLIIPGILLVILAKCGGRNIGMADGIVIAGIGASLSIREYAVFALALVMLTFATAAVYICKGKKAGERIAYIPVIGIAYIVSAVYSLASSMF